eukprot:gnl/TRDRNA2_/TRDRNA2_28594_c0_seq2.p1 gnl/TRDRNA2_/TRDRNA2_28594_c0~~gnl/TRDRNA2_/TRDRNA2_28594_c0_seq2.p1  ORF type:complete len:308 (+),score=26.77 gnl/TRDRNA2_/TRDRNA2_28594_c0_seq2:44-967(+)
MRSVGAISLRACQHFHCMFPVAVYPCADAVHHDWDGHCQNLADSPLEQWKVRRSRKSVLTCTEGEKCPDAGGRRCDDKAFDCRESGPLSKCDGRQKGLEMCSRDITGETYKCWYAEGQPEVFFEAGVFPIGWLISSIGVTTLGLCIMCIVCSPLPLCGADRGPDKACYCSIIVWGLLAIFCVIRWLVVQATGGRVHPVVIRDSPAAKSSDCVQAGSLVRNCAGPSVAIALVDRDAVLAGTSGGELAVYVATGCILAAASILSASFILAQARCSAKAVSRKLTYAAAAGSSASRVFAAEGDEYVVLDE